MKQKKIKRLVLNKNTISDLNKNELGKLNGGLYSYTEPEGPETCNDTFTTLSGTPCSENINTMMYACYTQNVCVSCTCS